MAETSTLTQADPAEPIRQGDCTYFMPPVDIYDTAAEVILTCDVPGMRREDLELRYERGELLLRGRTQARVRNGKVLIREYEEGDVCHAFTIPAYIDSSKIEAKCYNGVLTVRLPKVEAAQPKQITIQNQ